VSFDWNFGDGNSTFVTNPFHEYANPGTYTVTLTATHNGTGCAGSFSAPLTILETPLVDFSVDSAMQCYPGIFTFTDNIQAPFTYATWHFGDGQSVVQNDSVNHVYSDFGCYNVTLIVGSENGCVDSLTIPQMVCLFEQPIAYFTTDHLEYNSTNPMVTFFNESEFATSYYWEFGDSATSTAINPVHTYPEEESGYGIILTAYNEIGCSDQYGLFIMVREDRLFYVPNAFTPENKDGLNDVFMPIISSGYNPNFYNFTIFNRWGELIFETNQMTQGWDGNYTDASGSKPCPDGIYIWQINMRGITEDDATIYRGHVNLLR
jgi:gliding motility-associated-like protein